MNAIISYLSHPKEIVLYFMRHYCSWMADKKYIELYYRKKLGDNLDMDNPKKITEKLNWIKLYDQNPLYHKLVDKSEVKK